MLLRFSLVEQNIYHVLNCFKILVVKYIKLLSLSGLRYPTSCNCPLILITLEFKYLLNKNSQFFVYTATVLRVRFSSHLKQESIRRVYSKQIFWGIVWQSSCLGYLLSVISKLETLKKILMFRNICLFSLFHGLFPFFIVNFQA